MPAYPRHEIVADDHVGVYHCITRCVRRAFLCGVDLVSGKNHNHRKQWIRERLQTLASVFGIEVCGYAVMSNHLHAVLRVRPDLAQVPGPTTRLPSAGDVFFQFAIRPPASPPNPKSTISP